MSAPAPADARALLRRLLLRGTLAEKVDLGSWISVDAFLIGEGVVADDLNTLTDDDLDEVRRQLQQGGTLLRRFDRLVETVEESGLGPFGMATAIGTSIVVLLRLMHGAAHAAALAPPSPEPSNVAGLLVALVPVAIAVVLMACATRGQAQPADEEAFGDTTGFGERER